MPQFIIYPPQARVRCARDTPEKMFSREEKRFGEKKKKNTQVSPRLEVFPCIEYCYYLLPACGGCGKIDGIASCQPRSRARPRGAPPCIVLQKKAITMLMCRSRRVNPDVKG